MPRLAEPPVAVVDKVVLRRGTREVAQEYLKYLYSKEGQEIVARNFYRPRDAEVAAKYAAQQNPSASSHRIQINHAPARGSSVASEGLAGLT